MVTETTKKFIEQYLTLTIWFRVHEDDKDISTEQFEVVLQEIGRVEDELSKNGVSESAIQKSNDYGEQLYKTSIDQLSPNAQLRISKIVFGVGTKWAEEAEEQEVK